MAKESLQLNFKHVQTANNLSDLEKEQKIIDRAPFVKLKIRDAKILDSIQGREICDKCYKSRKFFCYSCCTPVIDERYIPRVKLPIKIDIIKHPREIDGKSTAIHAALIAPEDVRIYTYPEFPEILVDDKVVLIFPSKTACSIEDLFTRKVDHGGHSKEQRIHNEFPITRAIFIDSTWHQTKSIYKDPRLRELDCVVLKSRISQFWRHQKSSPRWYLATIEAIHQFLVELHTNAFGALENYSAEPLEAVEAENPTDDIAESFLTHKYSGQYDNLLYFFKYMYEKIHSIYDHDKLWAYKRPLI
ncbi:tRNA-uridine aminocarboxypropyltransferase 1 [Neodiprion pinetum]|uniref:tRNA-uridine aminocarboxypropyltransferase 1 n=1 Tax=Neodiprion pinetum TaxID=441929 RepID=UPI001EDF5AF7|nr:tRNA-uridine aminocarboxypropyltransferase 1 isoform X1 [Neodiprion pinetum]